MKLKNFEKVDNITTTQHLLIKSCLATTKEEREGYVREWEERVVINDIDFSSSRLIPYFYHGNQQHGITTLHDNRIKIIYKHWWLRTQHISHQLKNVSAALAVAGIKVVVFKGASIKLHYELAELRPMADFDLLIKRSHLHKGIEIIEKLDYTTHKLNKSNYLTNAGLFLDINNALPYTHKNNDNQIDLHWRVGSYCSTTFTEDLWQHLEEYDSIPTVQKPQLAYEVFLIIIHAVASENKDNLNWIIDIAVINHTADKSFWKEAREIAVAEKKEDLFDYGCSILLKLDVFALEPQILKKPRTLTLTVKEKRRKMNYIQLSRARFESIQYAVNRLYPHSSVVAKLYHMSRYFHYFLITKRFN